MNIMWIGRQMEISTLWRLTVGNLARIMYLRWRRQKIRLDQAKSKGKLKVKFSSNQVRLGKHKGNQVLSSFPLSSSFSILMFVYHE